MHVLNMIVCTERHFVSTSRPCSSVGADAAAAVQFIVIAIITGGDAISHLVQVGARLVLWQSLNEAMQTFPEIAMSAGNACHSHRHCQ